GEVPAARLHRGGRLAAALRRMDPLRDREVVEDREGERRPRGLSFFAARVLARARGDGIMRAGVSHQNNTHLSVEPNPPLNAPRARAWGALVFVLWACVASGQVVQPPAGAPDQPP